MSESAPADPGPIEPVVTPAPEPVAQPADLAPVADPPPTETVPTPEVPTEPTEDKKPELHTDTPTDFQKIDGDKPEEKPGEPKPEAPKPEEPATYDFVAPEGVTVVPEKMEVFTGLLKEHAIPPETGKKLFDLYVAERQQDALDTLTRQHQAFSDVRREWREQRAGDAEIGGAGIDTVTKIAAQARDRVVDDTNRAAFNKFLADTGAGDHPEFWRIMYRFGRAFQEPVPPPENRVPSPNSGGRPRGASTIFTHPTSASRS